MGLLLYCGQAAIVPSAGTVSARTVLTSKGSRDSRNAELSVTSTRTAGDSKQPIRVVFSGSFNVTATVWLSQKEIDSTLRSGDGATKPWTVSTALNFSALQGPLALSFGAANAYAAANLTATQPSSAQSAALGGSVRLADKALAGFGQAVGSARGNAEASAIGAAVKVQKVGNTAHGTGGATVQVQAGRGNAGARGTAAGIGDGTLNGTARSSATAYSEGAAGGVGTSGDAYYGESEAHGAKVSDEGKQKNDTLAFGMGYGSGGNGSESGGGGSGAAAGHGATSYSSHKSKR